MPQSRDPNSGQRLMNITDFPADIAIGDACLEDGRLLIEFEPEGYRSEYEVDWLYQNCYCINSSQDDRSESSKVLWHGASFDGSLPRQSYEAFGTQPGSMLTALRAVRDFGFVVLEGVPTEPGTILDVIGEFGHVRETNYGPLFEVRAKIDPNNLAYTNLGLGCHLDNPYRNPTPGLQLLHCLDSSVDGGETVLQDGFMAARVLREEHPRHFESPVPEPDPLPLSTTIPPICRPGCR